MNNIPFDKVVYFPQWENFIKPGEMNGEFRLQAKYVYIIFLIKRSIIREKYFFLTHTIYT